MQIVALTCSVESPKWLKVEGRVDEGAQVLRQLGRDATDEQRDTVEEPLLHQVCSITRKVYNSSNLPLIFVIYRSCE